MNSAHFETSHATTNPSIGPALGGGPMAGVLARMLDEIDYGLLLVTAGGALRFANQLALRALGGGGALRLAGGAVFAARDTDQTLLRTALSDAARGLRRLLTLNPAGATTSVAVLPLPAQDSGFDAEAAAAEPLVMLVLGKQSANQTLTLDFFARTHKLTSAETAVLRALCAGQSPKQAAASLCVAISTIRTQIGSIRLKTQTTSLRDLADKVAALPPITPAMKTVTCH